MLSSSQNAQMLRNLDSNNDNNNTSSVKCYINSFEIQVLYDQYDRSLM